MNNTRSIRIAAALGLALSVLWSDGARAHVVPPEDFHPAAESYRRMTFLLNLNPVPWAGVRTDATTIGEELSIVSTGAGRSYLAQIDGLIAPVESVALPSRDSRRDAAHALFELSTTAVATTLNGYLAESRESLSDFDASTQAFDTARQIWASFEHEVRATDREGFRALGRNWLSASSAMGNPGTLGVGAVPHDSEVFFEQVDAIMDYVDSNFGGNFEAPTQGRLVALPVYSDTFDAMASVPAKLPPGSNINKQLPRPRQLLNMAERGVDESETPLIALGDMVFDSPYIFGEPARSLGISCNTCHNKGVTNANFFIPGLSSRPGGMDVSNNFFEPQANNGHFGHIDTPDLRGIRFLAPYGRNGRIASLREFVRAVIVGEFNGAEPDPVVLDSMVAYLNEFDFLPNDKLDRDGLLSDMASVSAKRGETIFNRPFEQMNGRSCATCHIPSSQFIDRQQHDIGSVPPSVAYARDGAMDTPTLLGIKYTAPYFHDGSLPTLRSVVEWFNDEKALELSNDEVADLTAYLDTVGDGVDAIEDTMYTLEAEMEEFFFFLSSFEYLKGANKRPVIDALFQSISTEINAHKWDVQDTRYLPVLDRMAALMDDAYMANQSGDFERVDELVADYRRTYDEYIDRLK